jgi:hypothetical protein
MILHPKIGQMMICNYTDRMPCQGIVGEVVCVGVGPGPINVEIKVELWPGSGEYFYDVIPIENLYPSKTKRLSG